MTTLPTIAITIWNGRPTDLLASDVWAIPGVFPDIEAFGSYGHADERTMAQRAAGMAEAVESARDELAKSHPGVPFRYSIWPHRWGLDGFGSADTALLRHKADRLKSGCSSVFTANGRALFKKKSLQLMRALKVELKKRNLPMPFAFSASNEDNVDVCPEIPALKTRHDEIMADPRAKTELIDGARTYAEITSTLLDLDRKRITKLYPYIYDDATWKQASLYCSLSQMIRDYAMDDGLYQPARAVFPGVKCFNWNSYGSHRSALAHSSRFRESPVDAGKNWRGLMMPAVYGTEVTDGLNTPMGVGLNSHAEQLRRFGLEADYSDKNALAEAIHLELLRMTAAGCYLSAQTKKREVGMSITWRGEGVWTGVERYTDRERFPAEYLGAELDYNRLSTARGMFRVFAEQSVRHVEVFAQDATRAGLDRMAATLRSVARA